MITKLSNNRRGYLSISVISTAVFLFVQEGSAASGTMTGKAQICYNGNPNQFRVTSPGGVHTGIAWDCMFWWEIGPWWEVELHPGVDYECKIESDLGMWADIDFNMPCYTVTKNGGWVTWQYYAWTVNIAPQKILFTWNVPKQNGRYTLPADGQSKAVPSPAEGNLGAMTWSFVGNSLGCQLNETTGVITAGTNTGTITVQASISGGTCYQESLDLVDCEQCTQGDCQGLSAMSAINGSVDVRMYLGSSLVGGTAGYLQVVTENPAELVASPKQLRYDFRRPEVQKILDQSNWVKQVKAPECLAHVVVSNSYKYRVELYSPTNIVALTNGVFQLANSPFCTFTFENPGNDTNNLRVTQTREGSDTVYDYFWITNGWKLTSGNGLRSEIKTTALSESNTLKTVVTTVQQGAGSPVYQKTEKYRIYSYGERLVEDSAGTEANSLTNTYSYTASGFLEQVNRGDGYWEYYVYDSENRPTNIFSAFMNQGLTTNSSLCRFVENVYSTNVISGAGDTGYLERQMPCRRVEYVLGQEVGRTYFVALPGERREIRCTAAGAAWDNASNLVTITKLFTNGFRQNEIQSVLHPDGVIEIYQYGKPKVFSTNVNTTNIVLRGRADASGTNIDYGTKTQLIYDGMSKLLSSTEIDVASGLTTALETYQYDGWKRLTNTTFLDGTSITAVYDCCALSSTTDRDGTTTSYVYDALKRQIGTVRNGITTTNLLDANSSILSTVRVGTNGTTMTLRTSAYDLAGRLTNSTDALSQPTTYSESKDGAGQMVRTTTFADGGTRVETFAKDGTLLKTTGTAVRPVRYTNWVESSGGDANRLYREEIKLNASGADTAETIKTYFDAAGRVYKTLFSDGSYSQSFFNSKGQLSKEVDPDGVTMLYSNDILDKVVVHAVDMDRDGIIDFSQTDRIVQVTNGVLTSQGTAVRRASQFVWTVDNLNSSTIISKRETSVDGLHTWNYFVTTTNEVHTKYAGGGVRFVTNTFPAGNYTLSRFDNGRLTSVTQYDRNGSQISATTFGYDAHGRQTTVTDARNGTTTYTYNNADQVASVTTPSPTQVTTNYFDSMGRIWKVGLPDNTSVTNEFYTTGDLKKTYGSRTYPVEYQYDAQGRLTNMITWTAYPSAGAASTSWKYDAYRGFMTNKLYADGKGPGYTYTPAGRLRTRAWARGITTTYTTNAAGHIVTLVYSDSTPGMTNTYDRRGQLVTVVQGTNTTTLTYNSAGQLLTETCNGFTVNNRYDFMLRRTNVFVTGYSSTSTKYGYDAASRLGAVTNGNYTATYAYHTDSPLVSTITFRDGATTRLTTTKSYDNLNRLTSISNTPSSGSAIAFNYAYNSANQRTSVTNADDTRWAYQYDGLGQVTSGKRYWTDGTPVAGQQFEYAFDDIGNRKYSGSGGDQWGSNLRFSHYAVNNLNQYTSRTVPGSLNLIGTATNSSTVTVNDQASYRKNDYYQRELKVDNTGAAVYQGITNLAVLNQGTNADIVTNITGNLFLPETPEAFSYDADSNLTNDGRWVYIWDGENRLIGMTNKASMPSGAKLKLDFSYDYRSRRTWRVVSIWNGSTYVSWYTNKFVYDGWNLLGELDQTNGLVRNFVWGSDLSGTMHGAGGAGGLLTINVTTNGAHFPIFDGIGNINALVSTSSGEQTAIYEHGPFGELVRAVGPLEQINPLLASTKCFDWQSRLCYYGYRYYDASTGRWLSRDPLGERGGVNLIAFWENDRINNIDALGLQGVIKGPGPDWTAPSLSPVFPDDPIFNTQPISNPPLPQRTLAEDFEIAVYVLEVCFEETDSPWVINATAKTSADLLLGVVRPVATLGSGAGRGGALGYAHEGGNVAGVILLLLPIKCCPVANPTARTFTSTDPLVANLANKIESLYPGHVVGVNVPLRNAAGNLVTDADILLQNSVLQVKSGGSAQGLLRQLQRSEGATGLPSIGFGPNLPPNSLRTLSQQGGLVTGDENLLLQVIKP